MKTNAIIRIVAFSLAILILALILCAFIADELYLNSGSLLGSDTPDALEQINIEYISTDIRNIEIEWVAGSIIIQKDPNVTEIYVSETCPVGTEYLMVCKQSGQTLKIQFCEESIKFPSFGINVDVSKDLVITVPTNWNCNTLEIDAAATEVSIAGLQINELDFDGASGELVLENCDIVLLDIDTASGDVEFSGTLNELDFDAASASFRGEFFKVPNHLYLDAMSGDLEIILPSYCGFELQLDTMSGSFDSDFDFDVMGASYKVGDGACKIKVSAMSGAVEILKGVDTPQVTSTGQNCDH